MGVAVFLLAPRYTPHVLAGMVLVALIAGSNALASWSIALCPHCGRQPLGMFERGSPLTIDFCRHCFYWLIDPRSLR
ncbi:MAG: hypothetical protein ABIW82_13240 [Dokdonella sp.]